MYKIKSSTLATNVQGILQPLLHYLL